MRPTASKPSPVVLSRPSPTRLKVINGRSGLSNLGNTCLINSVMQCLLHTRVLVREFLNFEHLTINRTNPLGTAGLRLRLRASAGDPASCQSGHSFAPSELNRVLGEFAPTFCLFALQDSHLLLTFMLDGIHEDLNRVAERRLIDPVFGDDENDEETARRALEWHLARNDSIIVDHIHGQYKSTM
jgi:ubiquitin carboxyl-terminal hydrolase 4/11/15